MPTAQYYTYTAITQNTHTTQQTCNNFNKSKSVKVQALTAWFNIPPNTLQVILGTVLQVK